LSFSTTSLDRPGRPVYCISSGNLVC
jgi:hypothetical protein